MIVNNRKTMIAIFLANLVWVPILYLASHFVWEHMSIEEENTDQKSRVTIFDWSRGDYRSSQKENNCCFKAAYSYCEKMYRK